jgi:hypothetical protein
MDGRPQSDGGRRASYELFLSHSHADADLILRIAEQLDAIDVKVFLDQWELAPGKGVGELAAAMTASDAVAVFISGNPVGLWHTEEAYQGLVRAIENGTRAFFVWLPGSDPATPPPDMPPWLLARGRIVVRELTNGALADSELSLLVAGARNLTPRAAAGWLADRRIADRGR